MVTVTGADELRAQVGNELGVSGWRVVAQEAVDAFADVTGDHQWIHVDTERAASSPFGGTIAHGYFTLSLGPALADEVYRLEGFAFGLNYGLGKVRFPAPVPTGSRIRLRIALASVDDVAGGVQVAMTYTFERDGGDKPVCVAEVLFRLYEEPA